MDEQRERTARQHVVEMKEVKKLLERSCASVPDLVESDVESSDKDSQCNGLQFESGGDDVEVERDIWRRSLSPKLKPQIVHQRKLESEMIWAVVVVMTAGVGDFMGAIFVQWERSRYLQECGKGLL